ncbi:MAG: VOC family protein [Dehalococcoidales bacterium]|nr:MAG: VOC family protein [Dehalococcoidales bacterium]
MGYISPTLAVRNMKAAIDYYKNSLGFEMGMTFPDVENPQYADLSKDGMVLMLIPAENLGIGSDEKLGTGVNLYLQIDGDIDEYYDELKKKGVRIAVDIKDEPFGIRDFTVEDVDGYKLTFNKAS